MAAEQNREGGENVIGALIWVLLLQNRAQAATELLQELNSDVSGNFVEEVCLFSQFNWEFKTAMVYQRLQLWNEMTLVCFLLL